MKTNTAKMVVTSSLIALSVAVATVGVTFSTASVAEAQGNGNAGGNGNGNGGGNGNGNAGGNGHGMVARELGALNAAHANEQAFLNAAANSRVGELVPLREAYGEAQSAYSEWQEAYADYIAERDGWTGRTTDEIQGDIDNLDVSAETHDEDLEALEAEFEAADAHETRLDEFAGISDSAAAEYQEAEEAADEELQLIAADRDLSDAAVAHLRELLTR